MAMNKQDLDFYNDYFENQDDIYLVDKFFFNKKINSYEGRIKMARKNLNIYFKAEIPLNYPYADLKFYCNSFSGLSHQNYDKSVCLNTSFVNHLYTKLKLDTDKLRNWVFDYIENNKVDRHYEYIPADFVGKVDFLFQEDDGDLDSNDEFGIMTYSVLNINITDNRIERLTAFSQNIGNKETNWSSNYKRRERYSGLWVKISQEPIKQGKERILNWNDLIPLLPDKFFGFFHDFCKKIASYKLGPKSFRNDIFFIVGYHIPSSNGKELHWDLILLPKVQFPRKHNDIGTLLSNNIEEIKWEKTYNSSYNRFFGRGAFCKKITTAKILVIGVGAIGSLLCETLVRGGVTHLIISDIDWVEAGNICRSGYSFTEIGSSKVVELKSKLENISPFVEVGIQENVIPLAPDSCEHSELISKFEKYNLIFDCSANNGIIQMLSDMKLNNAFYHISITDKAKEMICLSNFDCDNIISRRNQMLFSLDSFSEATFREGTGCWHPTFEAAYFDINQLLHFTLKKINTEISLNIETKSFYSYFKGNKINSSEDICYIQNELGLKLRIESHCLDDIYHLVWQQYPNEFGGIFIGNYINDNKEVVISDVLFPDNYFNSPTTFEPDPIDLNSKLENVRKKHGDKVVYIGDWHSHPNSTNGYSRSDYNSIKAVANSSSVNTHNPILMIVAFGEDYFDPGFYVFTEKKLHKYDKMIFNQKKKKIAIDGYAECLSQAKRSKHDNRKL